MTFDGKNDPLAESRPGIASYLLFASCQCVFMHLFGFLAPDDENHCSKHSCDLHQCHCMLIIVLTAEGYIVVLFVGLMMII